MIPIKLEWRRPADGIELDKAAQAIEYFGETSNDIFRAKTDRIETILYEKADLENPVVMSFINAHNSNALQTFVARFGFITGWTSEYVLQLQHEARLITSLLVATTNSTDTNGLKWVNETLAHAPLTASFDYSSDSGRARLVLKPKNLLGLMALEVAQAYEVGAVTSRCAHCGKGFLTGPLTGRRSHAVYCSDRCRLAALRKRKSHAAKGES